MDAVKVERVVQTRLKRKQRVIQVLPNVWILFKVQGEASRGFKQEDEHGLAYDLNDLYALKDRKSVV